MQNEVIETPRISASGSKLKHFYLSSTLIDFIIATTVAGFLLCAFMWLLRWSPVYWSTSGNVGQSLVLLISIGASMVALTLKAYVSLLKVPSSRVCWAAYGASLTSAALVTSFVALDNFPTSADEYVYLFQAYTFEAGRLWNDPKPLGQALSLIYAWSVGDRWVGQYPPFWPAVLLVFDTLTPSARLANAITVTIIGFAIAYVVRRRAGSSAAWLTAGLFALCPFTIFNGASLLSHPMAAALGLTALIASQLSVERQSLLWSAAAGIAIGLVGITRLIAAPVFTIVVLLYIAQGKRKITRFIVFGLGGVPFVAILGLYQNAITGNPFRPAYWLSGRNDDHLYFDFSSIVKGIKLAIRYIIELQLWTSPFLLVLWLAAICALWKSRKLSPMDFAFPLGVCFFVFYPLNSGIRFGPRYYFDFWPCAVITIGSALRVVSVQYRPLFRRGLALSMCFGLVSTMVLIVEWRKISLDRDEVFHLADSMKLKNAVLCMDNPSGRFLPLKNWDFPRNGISDNASVLYVRCARTIPKFVTASLWKHRLAPVSIDKARAAYPSRSVWTYTRESGSKKGRISLLSLPLVRDNKSRSTIAR